MRRTIWSALAACSISWSAFTAAQPGRYAEGFSGTVRDRLRANLAQTNVQIYGAVGVFERDVMPRMNHNGVFAVQETNMMFGALMVPAKCEVCLNNGDSTYRKQYQLIPIDTYAFSAIFAAQFERLGLFYGAGVSVTSPVDNDGEVLIRRMALPLLPAMVLPLAHLPAMAAPFVTGPTKVHSNDDLANAVTYILGAKYDFDYVSIHAGFVGAGRGSGLYTNLNQQKLHLLASTLIDQDVGNLAYVKAGFERVPSLFKTLSDGFSSPTTLLRKAGKDEESRAKEMLELYTSSYFGRKVQIALPRGGAVDSPPIRTDFWSLHTEQFSLLSYIDVTAALGLAPSIFLHELRVGAHTPGFWESGTGLSISLGAVQLPPLYALAQQPGLRFAFRVEGRAAKVFKLAVYRNEPEILASFPYAYDAVSVNLFLDLGQAFYGMFK